MARSPRPIAARTKKAARIAPAAHPLALSSEVKAVQVERPIVVQTRQGEQLASPGQWLVTEPDGATHVYTDAMFRMQTLREQLLRMIQRSQSQATRTAG